MTRDASRVVAAADVSRRLREAGDYCGPNLRTMRILEQIEEHLRDILRILDRIDRNGRVR